MPRWTIAALALAVVLVLAWAVNNFGLQFIAGNPGPGSLPQTAAPRAGIYAGQPLQWRTLLSRRPTLLAREGTGGGLVAGRFEAGSTDEQVLLIGEKTGVLLRADGSAKSVGLHGSGLLLYAAAWDYDGDGVDEVLPDASLYSAAAQPRPGGATSGAGGFSLPTDTPVLDLTGREVTRIPALALAGGATAADFDGNGKLDISFPSLSISTAPTGGDVPYYSQGGTRSGSFRYSGRGLLSAVAADVDGDGKAELLLTSIKPSRLVALRSDGTQISFPNAGSPFMTPLGSGRFGSTARDDVFFSSGYLNATTGSMVPFGGPRAPGTAGNPPQDIWPRPVLFDLPALGGRVLAMPASSLDTMRPVISLYDAGGQLVYREIFAAPALLLGAARLRAAGKEHLVLQFEDRVLIYP